MPELTEAKRSLVIAQIASSDQAEPDIRDARPLAVASLEAEVDRPADGERSEVLVREERRRPDPGQYVDYGKGRGVSHPGQIDELFDRPRAELRPDPIV